MHDVMSPTTSLSIMRRPARAVLAGVAAALLLASPLPTAAHGADPEDELRETRNRQDEIAAELDLLTESDAALEARLDDLEAGIASQEAELVEVERAVEAAEARVADLRARVEAARARVEVQQQLINERAIDVYMSPGADGLAMLFESDDYNEFHTRNVLARQVSEHDHDVLAGLDDARDGLVREQAAAEEAETEAARRRAEVSSALDDLVAAREEQAAVRRVLRARMAEFRSEADALEATEADLVGLISARHARAAPTTPGTSSTTTTSTSQPGPPPSGSTTTTTTTRPPGSPSFTWPVSGTVTSGFGPRWGRMHNGIDIAASTGTPIGAAAAGEVFFVGWLGGYGNTVLVDHGNGYTTLYAHQSELLASEGESVSAGTTVGLVGSTGNSTGPHLHFEVRVWDTPHDPLLYLP